MRKSLPLIALLISASTLPMLTNASETLNYNVVNLSAEASREISNDQMHAILFIEKSHKQPAELAAQINQTMNKALATAKKYPNVKVETGTQNTYPIYDNDHRKLKEWRSHAQIRLESQDFNTTSQLIAALQQDFQTQSINFSVSDSKRQKVENELMAEASKNFQQRALALTQTWNKSRYELVSLNINTNSYGHQPMPRMEMMKASMADAVPTQEVAAGESKMTVNVNGTIQFK